MHIDGDAAAVVFNCDTAVRMDAHIDLSAHPSQSFVYRVVNHLIDEVMQGLDVRPAHIHPGAPANGFQALKDLDVLCPI